MIRFIWLAALAAVIGCGPSSAVLQLPDEAPSLTFDEPRAGTLVRGDTLRIQGWVSDDGAAVALELSLDGNAWFKVPVTKERFDAKVVLPVSDGAPLTLTLRATDAGKHVTRAAVKVRVDNVAPAVAFTLSPRAGVIEGSASDGSGLASLSVNTGEGEVAFTNFPFAWTPGDDGVTREVTVTAVDLAGNRTVVSHAVFVDVVPPALTISSPVDAAILGRAIAVSGTAQGVAKVQVALGAAAAVEVPVVGGVWSVPWSPVGLDFVAQSIDVVAVDEAGNVARESRAVTVDVVAPKLVVVSPVNGARLNAAAFAHGDGVEVKVAVTDGDPSCTVNNAVVMTSPTDNPKSYSVAVVVRDRAGNSASESVAFAVDRVPPFVLSRVPAVEGRNVATVASVDFSEDVSGGPGLMIPGLSGAWTTARHFEISGLEVDAVYPASLGAVMDAFGNPVVGAPQVRFHTAPKVPMTGVLANDVWQFESAADVDGVLTLMTRSPSTPATFRWTRVNPKTGVLEDLVPPMANFNFTDIAAYGEAQILGDLSARRISAATTVRSGLFVERRALSREGPAPVVVTQGTVGVVPRAAFTAEGVGLGSIGFLSWSGGVSAYARSGLPGTTALQLEAPTAMGFASDRWETVTARNGVYSRKVFSCTFGSCGPGALEQLVDVASEPAASFAIAEACTVSLYDSLNGARKLRLVPWCQGRSCGVQVTSDLPQVEQLRVSRDGEGGFIAAKRVPGGSVKLMRLACDGTFTDVPGGVVAVPLNAVFEPVALGKPALVYVDTGFTLKVFVP